MNHRAYDNMIRSTTLVILIAMIVVASTSVGADTRYDEAMKYIRGDGVPRDHAKALQLLTAAADDGIVPACRELGLIYLQQSPQSAMKYLKIAADKGDVLACRNYAFRLMPQKKFKDAYGFALTAAKKGDARACMIIGLMSLHGQGCPKSEVDSLKWLTIAASSGLKQPRAAAQGLEAKLKTEGKSDEVKLAKKLATVFIDHSGIKIKSDDDDFR